MIEFKIYTQIKDFVEANNKVKVYVYALFFLLRGANKQSRFLLLFFCKIAFIFHFFLSYFQYSHLFEEFSAIYLALNAFCQSKLYKQQPPKYICINCEH